MIDYIKAKKILIKSKIKIKDQLINSLDSLNRICSKNIYSPANYPSGNNTAFDGYAINSKDTINLNKINIQLWSDNNEEFDSQNTDNSFEFEFTSLSA